MKPISLMAGAVVALTLTSAANASADVTYYLDMPGNPNNLSGSITTDGTLGSITAADVTAWSFAQVGPFSLAFDSTQIGSTFSCLGAGGCFTATSTTLSFDFESTTPDNPFAYFQDANAADYVQFAETAQAGAGLQIQTGCCNGFVSDYPPASDAIASAPEPTTWVIMLVGLFGVGFGARFGRRKPVLAGLSM